MNNITIKMPENSDADDGITAVFDVSTEEGKKACLASFQALAGTGKVQNQALSHIITP